MKKILVIDDSALMRRVVSDIIDSTDDYQVEYSASDGAKGLSVIEKHVDEIDACVCDINMPNMNGLELLKIVKERKLNVPFIIFSSNTDINDTLTALELGAIEFIKKPDKVLGQSKKLYADKVLRALKMAIYVKERNSIKIEADKIIETGIDNIHSNLKTDETNVETIVNDTKPVVAEAKAKAKAPVIPHSAKSKKLVALCCSTGGPRALQFVIPKLPANLAAPVTIVQHMPAGFTESLAQRLDGLSEIQVKEAKDNEEILPGNCYIAKGGTHLTVEKKNGKECIIFNDEPPVVGLKPCGNIMYDSLINSDYEEIICVVMTGMGADGTRGILDLSKKKKIYVIAQDEQTSTVYGMPKAIFQKGIVDEVCALDDIAGAIIKKVGVL